MDERSDGEGDEENPPDVRVVSVAGRGTVGRWVQLLIGLFGFGPAIPLMIQSGLGLGPWDAFHVGIHNLTGISVGGTIIGVGVLIVLGSLLLDIRPGPGTLANMVLVGVFIDLWLPWVPPAPGFLSGLAYYAVALVIAGLATGMYISAGLGSGPRDGLMLGLSRARGWSVRRVRTMIELSVLAAGWAMGGAVGIGTIIFALAIGPVTQLGLTLFGVLPKNAGGVADLPPELGRRKAA